MGLLDDLKREADRIRVERDAEEMRQAELEGIYCTALAPRLIDIHRYLTEMLEHLEEVNWVVDATFGFPGIGRVGGLRQGNYRVHIDSHQTPKKVRLNCVCASQEEQQFSVDVIKTDELRQLLVTHQAFFTEWPKRDGVGKIQSMIVQAKLRVRAELLFEADIQGSRIRIVSHNFEDLTSREYWFGHAAIDENWLDGLGHYVLRKKPVLGGQEMSEEARKQLRQIAEQQRAIKMMETGTATVEANAKTQSGPGIFGNLRSRLFKSTKSD